MKRDRSWLFFLNHTRPRPVPSEPQHPDIHLGPVDMFVAPLPEGASYEPPGRMTRLVTRLRALWFRLRHRGALKRRLSEWER